MKRRCIKFRMKLCASVTFYLIPNWHVPKSFIKATCYVYWVRVLLCIRVIVLILIIPYSPFQTTESNSDKCNDIGQQVLVHGRRISFAEIEQKVNNITASQVRDVLSNYVYDRHPVISAVGQHENLYDLNRVTEKFFWWRT